MSSSSFAQAARARKVAALVEYFDATLVRLGRDPHREAGEMARTLRDHFDAESWVVAAHGCSQRKPSATTQAEVIATYDRRALANKAPRPAVLTTCFDTLQDRRGHVSVQKLWVLLPGTGDGERRFLGLVGEVSERDAIETARRCGFEAQVSL